MRIDLLDMGKTKYGDCILVRHGSRAILIDGAHAGDDESIRTQLEELLGHAPPFAVDLLVITHCHNDHIGCLPKLVAAGDLTAGTALVADEKLGWGRDAEGRSPVDARGISDPQRGLIVALQEEGYADLPDDELEALILEDATVEEKYAEMLEGLSDGGAKIVRYGRARPPALRALEEEFQDFGLKILGPTTEHLVLCADSLAQVTDALADAVQDGLVAADADGADLVHAYRRVARRMSDAAGYAADRPGPGAAKNNQSIVLKVEAGGWSALLAGDMQFAKAEVTELDPHMEALLQRVNQAGPYDFIKLTHHSSYNGLDETALDSWSDTKLFAHTGGRNDPDHPDEGVLTLLKNRAQQLKLARTDRNGVITVERRNGSVKMTGAKGRLNDFTVNQPPDEVEAAEMELARPSSIPARVLRSYSGDDEVVVLTRIPRRPTKVRLSIEVEPVSLASDRPVPPRSSRARELESRVRVQEDEPDPHQAPEVGRNGHKLPRLLFVTSWPRLESNIGRDEAAAVARGLRETQVEVLDLPPDVTTAEAAAKLVQPRLAQGQYAGVVLLGGFDVVPSYRLDVLDAAARQAVVDAKRKGEDADDFIVWSDELYGDRDGDLIPELPVSRIPDGRKREVIFGALGASGPALSHRFAVSNVHRPFAETVFPGLPGNGGRLEVSEAFAPEDIKVGAASGAVYYMLHGSARDATRFWGETRGGGDYEAIAVENVPTDARGSIVFSGCCWGALAMSPPAYRARPGVPLRPRGPEASIAIAYLQAGALAFIGCTGSHYSPLKEPYNYFGKPLHDAFWRQIAAGKAPAEALFEAKREFARGMPHGQPDAFGRAVEVKMLRQYTCLGLGW